MDEFIEQLKQLTLQCAHHLEEMEVEDLEKFVAERELLIVKIRNCSLNESDRMRHKEDIALILRYDSVIVQRMNDLKSEAGKELTQATKARKQMSAYYAAYTPDSYYFDKKK